MCYLAAMLLIHQTRAEECFTTFCNLVLNKFDIIYDFYNINHVEILKTYKVFWKLTQELTPMVYRNLKENDATCRMFLFEWIITLFSNSFDIDLCAILWDQIFFYGQHHILRISLALCQIIEKKFKHNLEDPEDDIDVQLVLKKARNHISNEEIISALKNQKLSINYIESLYQKV